MKTQFRFHLLAATFLFAGTMAVAQSNQQEEVPGDNFSLEGALELFKKSASPQEFEQLLNSPDSKVNNLDLNGDGQIDYVRVIDRADGNIHTFTMQSVVSDSEAQDVAVIELEKRSDGTAVLQIVGDADIYGIETIIEPTQEVRVNAGATTSRSIVNVWAWPSVQYVYGPYYSMWNSPWRWNYYPGWYRPWRPISWYSYNPYWAPYRPYYSLCYSHRVVYAPRLYNPYRSTSVIVYNRHNTQISHYRSTRSDSYGRTGSNHTYSRNNRYDNGSRSRQSSQNQSSYNGRQSRSDNSTNNTRSQWRSNNRTNSSNSRNSSSDNNNSVTTQRPARQFQSQSHQRSFSTPSAPSGGGGGSHHRSFSAPSGGSNGGGHQRSYSAPSGGGGGNRGGGGNHGGGGGNHGGGGGGGGASHGRRH